MSITSFVRKVAVQDAVYWEYDGVDKFSKLKYKEARPIKVRWDETTEIISSNDGREIVSSAQLLSPEVLKERSLVILGHIDDYPIEPNPDDFEDTFEIKKVDKIPTFRSKTFDVFIVYL